MAAQNGTVRGEMKGVASSAEASPSDLGDKGCVKSGGPGRRRSGK
jgi:hypothetical protein